MTWFEKYKIGIKRIPKISSQKLYYNRTINKEFVDGKIILLEFSNL